MALTRRDLLVAGTIALIAPRLTFAREIDWASLSYEDTEAPSIPSEMAMFDDQPSLNGGVITGYQPMGTERPSNAEVELAGVILNKAPTNCTVIEVALYYLAVGQGKFGEDRKPYTTAWPVRWNPVIVEFFKSTGLQPSGDTTAWCAAFMNYCLKRSSQGKALSASASLGTKSAAALSFRNWGTKTENPLPGDIVVFQNKSSPGNGHVGFFLADQGDSVLVLGGNQFEGTPRRHTINRKILAKDGPALKLLTYRTEEQLHA